MRLKRKQSEDLCSEDNYSEKEILTVAECLINPCIYAHFSQTVTPLAGRGTYPLRSSHALQFHLLQVGGSKRHVVINEVRDQGGRSVIF